MTRREFLIAAAKGQGRAIAALRNRDIQPSFHDLRRFVIRWPGYDWQCERGRGWYTVELIEASDHDDLLKELLVRHLSRMKGERPHRSHRAHAVGELAKRGFAPARDALYACFRSAGDVDLGDEIIEADGLAGLEWILNHAVERLVPGETWQFDGWLDDLRESLGEPAVSEWLITAPEKWPVIGDFVRAEEERGRRAERPVKAKPKISFEEFQRQYFAADPASRKPFCAVRWIAQAAEEEQTKAWAAFSVDEDPDWLRALSHALVRRPKLAIIDKIVARAPTWRDEPNPFVRALEGVRDSRVRQLGFDLIAVGRPVEGISLFRQNFQTGDENALLEAARSLTNDFDRHGVGLDFLDIPIDEVHSNLLIWTYENTPCSFCRESALRHLDESSGAPTPILQEALLDCEPEARALARRRLEEQGLL